MKYVQFGQTGLRVSELCYGSLILGTLQADVTVEDGARAIRRALELGINFIDTAEVYRTYGHISAALKGVPKADRPIVASKSMAKTGREMQAAVEEALRELDMERIDIFLLHSVDSREMIETERAGALEYLLKAKAEGKVGHIGISSHSVPGVAGTVDMPEIEVVLPIINKAGRGLRVGTMPDMLEATKAAFEAGKAIYVMKALAGGHLRAEFPAALNYVRDLPFVHVVTVGMKTPAEVDADVAVFEGRPVPENLAQSLEGDKRVKVIYACTGCGSCTKICPAGALSVVDGKAICNHDLCVLCGYCGSACPRFCIRIV